MDGQIEVDVLEEHLFVHWCHFFSRRRLSLRPIICGLLSVSASPLTDSSATCRRDPGAFRTPIRSVTRAFKSPAHKRRRENCQTDLNTFRWRNE